MILYSSRSISHLSSLLAPLCMYSTKALGFLQFLYASVIHCIAFIHACIYFYTRECGGIEKIGSDGMGWDGMGKVGSTVWYVWMSVYVDR